MEGTFATGGPLGSHPAEPDLLALVEGELEGEALRALEAHVARCPVCAAAVEAQRAARAVLRAAPAVELALPPLRELLSVRGAIVADAEDGAQARAPALARGALGASARFRAWLAEAWRRRPVLVLAPVAGVAAAAVLVVVLLARGGSGAGPSPSALSVAAGSAPADAMTKATGTTTPAAAATAPGAVQAPGLIRSVAGTAAEVVARLEQDGIQAKAGDDGTVAVAAADRDRAAEALAPLADGLLQVIAR